MLQTLEDAIKIKPPLSMLIKLGAMLRPQAVQHLMIPHPLDPNFERPEKDDITASCALGCASEMLSIWSGLPFSNYRVHEMYRSQLNMVVEDPFCYHYDTVQNIIIDLNNVYEWSREKIAEWLASIGL